jgi:hypothetical protein
MTLESQLRKGLTAHLSEYEDPILVIEMLSEVCLVQGEHADEEAVSRQGLPSKSVEADEEIKRDVEASKTAAAAWYEWAERLRLVAGKLRAPNQPHKLLAASPAYGGPATRPYRWVLVEDSDLKYIVYRKYLDTLGGRDSGYYFGAGQQSYRDAKRRWLQRTEYEQEQRDERCDVIHPVGAPPLPVK